MNKTVKWILIAVAIMIGIALVIVLILNLSKPAVPPANPNSTPGPGSGIPGILNQIFSSDWIKNLFGPKDNMANPACQSGNPGYDNNGNYTRACGGVPGGGDGNCDPDNPGKDMNGFLVSTCGGGARIASSIQYATMANINMMPASRLSQLNALEKNILQQLYNNINGLRLNNQNISTNEDIISKFIQSANTQLKNIGSNLLVTIIPANTQNARVNCTGEQCWEVNVILFKFCHCRPVSK